MPNKEARVERNGWQPWPLAKQGLRPARTEVHEELIVLVAMSEPGDKSKLILGMTETQMTP